MCGVGEEGLEQLPVGLIGVRTRGVEADSLELLLIPKDLHRLGDVGVHRNDSVDGAVEFEFGTLAIDDGEARIGLVLVVAAIPCQKDRRGRNDDDEDHHERDSLRLVHEFSS